MKILVTGGRDFTDESYLFSVLDQIHAKYPIELVIHGAAKGADSLAEKWAKSREVPYLGVPARWTAEGKPAGPKRNSRLLSYQPDVCVAFKGGYGTGDMKKKAARALVPVWEY